MIPFKAKIKKTTLQRRTEIKSNYGAGYALRLQSFRYDCVIPNSFLRLLDLDGDEFIFRIPGQGEPKASSPDVPICIRLPIFYYDDTGGNEFILWGEVEKIDKLDSGF